jgi:hypothetical protein
MVESEFFLKKLNRKRFSFISTVKPFRETDNLVQNRVIIENPTGDSKKSVNSDVYINQDLQMKKF